MTRRCQSCARLFPGDVCPGCGFDHVIHVECTEEERCGLPPRLPAARRGRGIASLRRERAAWDACRSRVDREALAARLGVALSTLYGAAKRFGWSHARTGHPLTGKRPMADRDAIRRARADWEACRSMADREALAARFGIRLNTLYAIVKPFGWPTVRTGYKLDGSPLTESVNARGLNNWGKVPRPVGGPSGPIGRTERPGSGRGTSPKGAA